MAGAGMKNAGGCWLHRAGKSELNMNDIARCGLSGNPNVSAKDARLPPTVSARWSHDADVTTIARAILGTLKYEPRRADLTMLRRALESVVLGEGGPGGRS
jgi:hypothetical protein